MSRGFVPAIIVDNKSGVMLGETEAVDCKRLIARRQSPSLPS